VEADHLFGLPAAVLTRDADSARFDELLCRSRPAVAGRGTPAVPQFLDEGRTVRNVAAGRVVAAANRPFTDTENGSWTFLLGELPAGEGGSALGASGAPETMTAVGAVIPSFDADYDNKTSCFFVRARSGAVYAPHDAVASPEAASSRHPLAPGDVVTFTWSGPARSLSLSVNGDDRGVLFKGLPVPILPAVAFYGAQRAVTLVSCTAEPAPAAEVEAAAAARLAAPMDSSPAPAAAAAAPAQDAPTAVQDAPTPVPASPAGGASSAGAGAGARPIQRSAALTALLEQAPAEHLPRFDQTLSSAAPEEVLFSNDGRTVRSIFRQANAAAYHWLYGSQCVCVEACTEHSSYDCPERCSSILLICARLCCVCVDVIRFSPARPVFHLRCSALLTFLTPTAACR
jgi:hypothetical protein